MVVSTQPAKVVDVSPGIRKRTGPPVSRQVGAGLLALGPAVAHAGWVGVPLIAPWSGPAEGRAKRWVWGIPLVSLWFPFVFPLSSLWFPFGFFLVEGLVIWRPQLKPSGVHSPSCWFDRQGMRPLQIIANPYTHSRTLGHSLLSTGKKSGAKEP